MREFIGHSLIKTGAAACGAAIVVSAIAAQELDEPNAFANPSEFDQDLNDTLVEACYASLNLPEISTIACNQALSATPDATSRAQVLAALAILTARNGEVRRAEDFMQDALALAPANPNVLINLGNLRIKQSRFAEAVEAYGEAQDAGALEEPALYLNRSLALRAMGRYDDAKKDYDYFLTLKEQLSKARLDALDEDLSANIVERGAPLTQ